MTTTIIEVKERPILFNGDMVRAILDGRKTQTRRLVKPQPNFYPSAAGGAYGWDGGGKPECPYGAPGGRLWVRETWEPLEFSDTHVGVVYDATPTNGLKRANDTHWYYVGEDESLKWSHRSGKAFPSIHMPRWASRITLKVADVRVERLQEVGEEDAIAEGMTMVGPAALSNRTSFARLWDSINTEHDWASNPWVWVVTFTKVN